VCNSTSQQTEKIIEQTLSRMTRNERTETKRQQAIKAFAYRATTAHMQSANENPAPTSTVPANFLRWRLVLDAISVTGIVQ
jgi:hypothetical protein